MADKDANEFEDSTPAAPVICPHCNAKQLGPSETCWLCHKSLADSTAGMPPPEQLRPAEPESMSFSLATLFLVVTLVSVCMGLLVAVPGLGVVACIVMVPVVARTIRVVRHRESAGDRVGAAEKMMLFVTSFAVASVLLIVVCVSTFCTFCGLCLTMFSLSNGGRDETTAWAFGMCVAAVVSIAVLLKMIAWSRRRYRRDMSGE